MMKTSFKRCAYRYESGDDQFCGSPKTIGSGKLSPEICGSCFYRDESATGVGDLVSDGLELIRISKTEDCGCAERQKRLNELFPLRLTGSDQSWFVAVTTSRRAVPTLHACLVSLRSSGWADPVVFAEPESDVPAGFEIRRNKARRGLWFNWLHSCQEALKSEAELIMTVQDDAFFHRDSKAFAEECLWPSAKAGTLSLYTPAHYSHQENGYVHPLGVNRIITRSFWGALALVWSREVLIAVINHPIAKSWRGAHKRFEPKPNVPDHLVMNSDTAIGQILFDLQREVWVADPSPVRHIAKASTVGHGGNSGNRNCLRCATEEKSLFDQCPLPPIKHSLKV